MADHLTLIWQSLEIVWINLLLSGDNAILIALACRSLPEKQKRIGFLLGAAGAVGLRLIFTLAVEQLLELPVLKIGGGLFGREFDFVERKPLRRAAAFFGFVSARVVNQNLPHQSGRDGEKMRPVLRRQNGLPD